MVLSAVVSMGYVRIVRFSEGSKGPQLARVQEWYALNMLARVEAWLHALQPPINTLVQPLPAINTIQNPKAKPEASASLLAKHNAQLVYRVR